MTKTNLRFVNKSWTKCVAKALAEALADLQPRFVPNRKSFKHIFKKVLQPHPIH
jgi:hypothetical protein